MTSPYEKMPCGHLGRFELTNPLDPESPVLCALCEIKRLESELAEAKKQAVYWQESAEDWKAIAENRADTILALKTTLEKMAEDIRYLSDVGILVEFSPGTMGVDPHTTPWDFAQAALDKVFRGENERLV